MPRPEPGDGGVIGVQVADNHPVGHVACAPRLDDSAGPLALAVAIEQQRDHHLRVVRGTAVPVAPVATPERANIEHRHRVQHHEHQIVLGQPIPHVDRQQHRLITLRRKEVLRHTP